MSSTAVMHPIERAPATAGIPGVFTREQIELIKRTVAEGTTDDELALFLEVCRSTGLDPFRKQIYAIVRDTWNPRTRRKEPKMTIQTGIDGFRVTAANTGQHAGTSDAEYGPADARGNPEWARITVYRLLDDGTRAEFTATARFKEYAQTDRDGNPLGQWGTMPYNQLAKCAEALALRKAFSANLSGVYTKDEMGQASNGRARRPAVAVDVAPGPARERRPARFRGESLYSGDVVEAAPLETAPADQPAPEATPLDLAEREAALDAAKAAMKAAGVTAFGLSHILAVGQASALEDLDTATLNGLVKSLDVEGAAAHANREGYVRAALAAVAAAPDDKAAEVGGDWMQKGERYAGGNEAALHDMLARIEAAIREREGPVTTGEDGGEVI